MAVQPSPSEAPREGPVTLLFTRLDDADGLWRRFGQGLRTLLTAHDGALRDHLGRHGYPVKREATGFLYAFSDAAAALRAASAAQDALLKLPWASLVPNLMEGGDLPVLRVGFGLHTGIAIARENPLSGRIDYLGPTANLAGRVAYATAGDQILFTRETLTAAEAAGYAVDSPDLEGAWIALRGTHRFKGVGATVEIFELRPRRLRTLPLLPVMTTQALTGTGTVANLPAADGPLLGRDELLLALSTAVTEGNRWIALVGPLGAGKSRLAIEFARWCLAGVEGRPFPGGVWWIDLANARDLTQVIGAIARSTRIALFDNDAEDQLVRALGARGELLLILDGAESLSAPIAHFLGRLTSTAPSVFVVVSSQVNLRDSRVLTLEVGPLPCPAVDATPEELARNPAVRLITDRLRTRPEGRKALDPSQLRALGVLVRRLDGLPRALALAVAAPAQVTAQQALTAATEWASSGPLGLGPSPEAAAALRISLLRSWEMLPPWAQAALAQLSVFRGPFTLDAAEAVLDLRAWPEAPPALDIVELLMDHHLMSRATDAHFREHTRLVLPSLTQAFGLERLSTYADPTTGDAREEAELRHGRAFARLGEAAALLKLRRMGGAHAETLLVAEQENLQAACRRAERRADIPTWRLCTAALLAIAARRGPPELAADLIGPLLRADPSEETCALAAEATHLLVSTGRGAEGHRIITQAIAALGRHGPSVQRARLLTEAAAVMRARGAHDKALELLETAVTLARSSPDPTVLCRALARRADLLRHLDRASVATPLLTEALSLAEGLDDLELEAEVLRSSGATRLALGLPAEAILAFEAALELLRELGQIRLIAGTLLSLVEPHRRLGRIAEAEALVEQATPLLLRTGDYANAALACDQRGELLAGTGRHLEARSAFEEALRHYRRTDATLGIAMTLCNLGRTLLALGAPQAAFSAFSEATPRLATVGTPALRAACAAGLAQAQRQSVGRADAAGPRV